MKTDRKIDARLVKDYLSGNDNALAELVKCWHKLFCTKAYWIVKDKDVAKDIAQESWKTIMDKLPNLKNHENFGNWATRIVYNKSLDWIKFKAKERDNNLAYYNEQYIFDDEIIDDELVKKKLLQAIISLPNNQQIVIRLFYVEDYSLKEIAEILDISLGTAKSRLFHAREKLKTIIKNK